MSSIALFYNLFSLEKDVREQLAAVTGYRIVQDRDVIRKTAEIYQLEQEKVERALYGPTSVFNSFTQERENNLSRLKLTLAEMLAENGTIFSGAISLLIPQSVTHILRVGLFDDHKGRIQRAMQEGLIEKKAVKAIKKSDASVCDLVAFLHLNPVNDRSQYDIFIPMGSTSTAEAVQLIVENYRKPAVLESAESMQAVTDMQLAARVELNLLEKGYTNDVRCINSRVTITINKSVHSFEHAAKQLSQAAKNVSGVANVDVVAGKDYHSSIYRDHDFKLPPKVLLVDDEQEFVQTLSERLNTRNYGSYPVFDGEQAVDLLDSETPDVMVLDLKMPGMHGVEVLQKTKEIKPEVEVIILTGHGSEDDRKTCMELGAFAYLQKPVDIVELTAVIDEAYKKVAAMKVANL
ncbi:response regulator [Desulfogranum japonicum]|uniref:response regulator n=1 Tax=Desulfogranum japonicum TaxID=231447 RepID=UPI00040CCD9C|nr:response regulator [Desulfogranum japonicum]